MTETRDIPIGIWLFVIFIIVFDLYYFYLLFTQGPHFLLFASSIPSPVMWINVLLTIISLFVIPYGFLKGRNWARIFALVFILWSAFLAIAMIIVRWKIIEHYLLFVIYVVMVMYLLMSPVKRYFGKTDASWLSRKEDNVYQYGEYTLYSKDVKLRSGRIQTIYFFSRKTPVSGRPCNKPDNFIVNINPKSGMPYLKKKQQ